MKRISEVKRGTEEKKRTAKLKDCPNKLISGLGVKKTPQNVWLFSLLSIPQPQLSASFFLFDLNFFSKGGKLCQFFANLYKITVLLIL